MNLRSLWRVRRALTAIGYYGQPNSLLACESQDQARYLGVICVCVCVCTHSGSSVHEMFQARILEQVTIFFHHFLQGILDPRIEPISLAFPALAGGFFTTSTISHTQNRTILEMAVNCNLTRHNPEKQHRIPGIGM